MIALHLNTRGIAQIRARLKRLESDVQAELRAFLEDAGDILADAARREAPVGQPRINPQGRRSGPAPGTLKRAIHRSPVTATPKGYRVAVEFDDSTKTASGVGYEVFVQKGTRPHIIRPRNAKALAFQPSSAARQIGKGGRSLFRKQRGKQKGQLTPRRSGQTTVFAREVHHPGTRPNPFMTRAIERARPAIKAREQEMMRRIARKARAG